MHETNKKEKEKKKKIRRHIEFNIQHKRNATLRESRAKTERKVRNQSKKIEEENERIENRKRKSNKEAIHKRNMVIFL